MSKNSKLLRRFLSARKWKDEGTKRPEGSGYVRSPQEALDRIIPKKMSSKKQARWARVCLHKGD